MSIIGVLGGMGPSATVDFLDKLVRLTPALRDQEHLPFIVVNLPHIHDRSSAILGSGRDPLPQLLVGAIPATLLSLGTDYLFGSIQRRLTPIGMRT